MQKIEFTNDEKTFLKASLQKLEEDKTIEDHSILTAINSKFMDQLNKIRNNGPTSQLWVQYFELICLTQRFIDAERSCDFKKHLDTVQLMIPILYASVHHNYAKCAQLYLQKFLN